MSSEVKQAPINEIFSNFLYWPHSEAELKRRKEKDGADYEPFPKQIYFAARAKLNAFHILKENCELYADRLAMRWFNEYGIEEQAITFGQMLREIRAVAKLLSDKNLQRGDRAMLVYVPGLDFFYAFWACLSLGVIPVPVCPADPFNLKSDVSMKVTRVHKDCSPAAVLTTKEYLQAIQAATFFAAGNKEESDAAMDSALNTKKHLWLTTDGLKAVSGDDFKFDEHVPSLESVAFLQYTSGSTGSAKGVMVSHGNLLSNGGLIIQLFAELGNSDTYNYKRLLKVTGVSWLPTFHDMGLIGFHVTPLLTGVAMAYMSPMSFIANPIGWLKLISKFEIVVSGAPSFALDLCARKATDKDIAELKLDQLQALLIGAEAVRDSALSAFTERFKSAGFRPDAYMPSYGLAENVLLATSKRDTSVPPFRICIDPDIMQKEGRLVEVDVNSRDAAGKPKEGRWIVSSGQQMRSDMMRDPGCVIVVDPKTKEELPEGRVGEIWITGKSRTLGYWNKKQETQATFRAYLSKARNKITEKYVNLNGASNFLATGDMGVWYKGHMFVTGRMKEMIIINGQNYYPADIEDTVRSLRHPAIREGSITAFAVETGEQQGFQEKLAVMLELRDPSDGPSPVLNLQSKMMKFTMLLAAALAVLPGVNFIKGLLVRAFRFFTYLLLCGHVKAKAERLGAKLQTKLNGLVQEIEMTGHVKHSYSEDKLQEITQAVRKAVLSTYNVPVHDLVLLRARTIMKTSSGKNRRTANKAQLLAGDFDHAIVKRFTARLLTERTRNAMPGVKPALKLETIERKATSPDAESKRDSAKWKSMSNWIDLPDDIGKGTASTDTKDSRVQTGSSGSNLPSVDTIKRRVLEIAAKELELDIKDAEMLDPSKPLDEYGLDSVSASKLTKLLGEEFKAQFNVFQFLGDPSINGVAMKIHQVLSKQQYMPTNLSTSSTSASTNNSTETKSQSQQSQVQAEWHELDKQTVPYILGIGTAVPAKGGSQKEACATMIRRLGLSEKKAKLLNKIGEGSKIDMRYMVFKGEEEIFFGRKGLGNDEGLEPRNAVYKKEAIPLSITSAKAAIEDWKQKKEDITHVVAVTCTGVIIPGLEFHIMQGLGLSPKAERLSIQFMGCFGALSGMKTAKALARENPNNRVLLVCTELCSLHLQMDDRTENLVASCLFADGSGAMIIGCQPRPGERPLFEIHHSNSTVIPNTLEMMKWEISNTGMIIGLDRHISTEIYQHIVPFAHRLLGPKLEAKQCTWAIHPGGPMVIKAITDALGLADSDAKAGWEVLRKFGNMSSASLIFVFNELRAAKLKPGKWIPALAFGPGLNVEGAILRAV